MKISRLKEKVPVRSPQMTSTGVSESNIRREVAGLGRGTR